MATDELSLSCVSWNIHRGRGEDGVVDPARTRDVLVQEVCRAGTEILALQEADGECPPHAGILDIGQIEARTGLRSVHTGPARRWGPESDGFLGLICFVGPDIDVDDVALLDLPGHCHRGAVVLDLRRRERPFRVVCVHLSLSLLLRMAQMRTLGQHLFRREARPTILCGDFNEWQPWGGPAFRAPLVGQRFAGPVHATFPVWWPILPLDRFLAGGGARVQEASVLDGPGIRRTSDHRPLAAQIALGG